MIRPEEIRTKAENIYPEFLRTWLADEAFFPRIVPCDKRVDANPAVAIESVRRLRSEAKESRGFGYSVEWKERNSRAHGRNLFPRQISFETQDDLLTYIGKQREFATFVSAVEEVRSRYPALESWIRGHRQLLIESTSEIDGLLQVVDFLRAHPRPGLFARELPLDVDTKFIERNHCILQDWLDLLLPPHAIRADEDHFARRYGLRYAEQHVLIRFLDEELQTAANSPWAECSVPINSLAENHIPADRVLVVENKVNLLTLPRIAGTLALGGLGNSVTDLSYVNWLDSTDVWYWGDIDVEGFTILSRLRLMFPHVRSLLMDERALQDWRDQIASLGTGHSVDPPSNLTPSERTVFQVCAADNIRIEQERLPHPAVFEYLRATFFPPVCSM